ncbi:MAG: hypothetical protein PHI00_09200 [Atribacterota bacterium]|jgi:type VI secretion system protein VasI|nr:hypothetical protein [Atribacterota bacterium]
MKRDIKILLPLLFVFLCSTVFAQEQETKEIVDNWTVSVEINPLTDEKEIYLCVYSEDYKESKLFSDRKALYIRFMEEPDLFIVWNKYLGNNTNIRYKFDNGEIWKEEWYPSADKTALFCPTELGIRNFIKKATNAKKLVVGVTPYNKTEQTAVFNLEGLKEAITPYLSDFGWEDLFEE